MPSRPISRRRVVTAGAAAIAALTGCLSDAPGSDPTTQPSTSSDDDPTTDGTTDDPTTDDTTTDDSTTDGETPSVASLSVADFFEYALAGTHPHVHRRSGTQYVIVRLETGRSFDAVRESLSVTLDGDALSLAERQPVRWANETVDVAFAASKDLAVDRGSVRFDGTELRSLADGTVARLNAPPTFEVSDPSVSPAEVRADERATATVRFAVENAGEGRGTFGASLSGNFVSGSNTLTATLDAGEKRELSGETRIVGEGDEATVRLDWGADEWSTGIPVVGGSTTPESSTPTASDG